LTDRNFGQFSWNGECPLPREAGTAELTLAHGEGGREMRRLIEDRIWHLLRESHLSGQGGDAARLPRPDGPIAMTTDSFVVTPLFFPGGDIGHLAVYGTVNDLAVMGAIPRWMSLAFILEEGFPLREFDRILKSIAAAAEVTQVRIVTGDTKVVPRGKADGVFINTTGIGEFATPAPPGPSAIEPGDLLIITGPIGRHGLAILAAREKLGFEPPPQSDCGPLIEVFRDLRDAGLCPRAARDATRGGVAAVCHEWAQASGTTLRIEESELPVSAEIRGACELLGLDPLFLANEGTAVLAVESALAIPTLQLLRSTRLGTNAAIIGEVRHRGVVPVVIGNRLGRERVLEEPTGAPMPRIC